MVTPDKLSTCTVPQIIKKKQSVKLFEEAITDYGAPSRIWIDKRGENTLISKIMAEIRGNGRRSFLASSSVHNQRTERLWRDL